MNDLEKYFESNQDNLINKWMHYFDIYDQYFSKYRDKEIVFVEIGVFQGGSLQMWKEYFGPKAKIYGIDINPECKQFEDEQVTILPHCQNSCHPHLNNPNGEKGDNHGTIQCRTQTSYTEQTFIT